MTNKKAEKLLSLTQNKFYFILGISLVFIIMNLLIGLYKPFWLDEITSLNLLNVDSVSQLVYNVYKGVDTNPPLYFIAIYFIRNFLYSDVIIKLFSLVLCLCGLLILYKLLKGYVSKQAIILTLLILSISNFFAEYLIVEARSYSLFFFFTILFLYQFHNIVIIGKDDFFNYIKITLISTALLYTHYFWLSYVCIVILFAFFLRDKRIKIRLITSLSFSLLLFAPWIKAIQNQSQVTMGIFWQKVPNLVDILTLPMVYIGRFVLLILIISIIFLVIKKQSICTKRIMEGRNFFILLLLFLSYPILNYIFALLNFSISEPRYYIPTYISLIIIIPIIIDSLRLAEKKSLLLIFLLLISLNGFSNIIKYYGLEKKNKKVISNMLDLNNLGLPVVCESPHKFFPYNYYAQKKGKSFFYFVLDQKSAYLEGNTKNAIFDYYWMRYLKIDYDSLNILGINEFEKEFKVFYIVNENNRMIMENRFEYNPYYRVYHLKDDIFKITKLKE